jgi:hypothetical protein
MKELLDTLWSANYVQLLYDMDTVFRVNVQHIAW